MIKNRIEEANTINKLFNSDLNIKKINEIISFCIKSIKAKKKIIFCGNGGSTSDSLHLTAELIGRFKKNRKPIRALSLNSEISTITAISNDFGYENIFYRQLMSIGDRGDTLISLSTSGKSKNILKVLKLAKRMKIKTILLSSNSLKGKKKISDIVLKAPTSKTDRAQEIHILVGHLICEELEKNL